MLGKILDRAIGAVSPERALRRMHARATLEDVNKLIGAGSGYNAAALNRLTRWLSRRDLHENALRGQFRDLRALSWDLYRNNPHARKIVRQIETKVIGRSLRPQSLATRPDGRPFPEFRERAQTLWNQIACEIDARGRPGRGGQHWTDLSKTGLRSVVLSGSILYRLKPLSDAARRRRGLRLPLTVQLIHPARLDQSVREHSGRDVIGGVELTSDGLPAAYHLLPFHPSDPRAARNVQAAARVPAETVGHLFVADDVDQILGVPWFAPALETIRDTGDYQHNELKAAAMGACVVAGYRRPQGASEFGLENPDDWDLADADGNKITNLQPGIFLDLGTDGGIEGFNPQRPNTNTEAFVQHLLRVTATSQPGIKGSTLTGDYRKSSFASERSADNEVWPEIEGLQSWWSCGFAGPIYEEILTTAVLAGLFDGVPGFSLRDFAARRDDYLAAEWQGPVARSINPKDDAEASALEIKNGTSSPQIEAAKRGRNWLDVLKDLKEYVEQVEAMDFPPEVQAALIDGVLAGDAPGTSARSEKSPAPDPVPSRLPLPFEIN